LLSALSSGFFFCFEFSVFRKLFFFSSRRRHTSSYGDWSSDVCSSDLFWMKFAVRAIQCGAANFIQKPWDNDKLLADVQSAISTRRVHEENVQLKRALKERYSFENIVGKSDPMLRIFDLVAQVAPSRSTVLIQGESGTGKELIAKAIHMTSGRKDRPFVPVNTGSMPSDLLESTLFGHLKGAFTSAIASKKGLF